MNFPAPYRELFPHTQTQIYLNHAAISPFSTRVVETLNEYIAQRHLTEIENYFSFQPKLQEARERLARLLHTHADRIAFSQNTSGGFNILAASFPWQPGDRILLNRLEFPANVYPFENLRHLGVEIDYVTPRGHYLALEDFAAAMTPRTRLLSVSQVQFLSGQRINLEGLSELCHAHGTWLSVDSIQALGATDLNVETLGIDFVSCGGHKWLMGPAGAGFLYISKRLQAELKPVFAGWLSVENEWDLLDYELKFRGDACRFETGTLNFLGIAGLHAALGLFEEIGMHTIETHILFLTAWLRDACEDLGLKVITPAHSSERLGILTLDLPPAQATHLYEILTQNKVECSLREERYLRFSPHFYNTQTELERVLEILKAALE
ncbi:aminotransferase [bacterium (Candidatus Blackallbacteria) CG17_big_fil_post_rev_8_21_14_2_50_48_46]|uniref:Aminotransferase n=1 Tax=bacterium (Candidatus Blackallbacteria) CG17_big_fil_post_rev_8_21_14_2_50_48_46 TaxID=2014261 RepID=A0A2M7G7Q7_9BACT|nr:MAG: aminotransferase [bacterium (Candidatus Blackallbacteria) CG18_big_fil_WC_8_21_14_2_50_49_26]PIW18105.1 MAG: aminotransferase [bacterium (Candidatus Blackallbacteria) CG17_big_fil_post_rev_8_21_14_2_50_48_46]PIW51114.1 MAG: aminotransferase [bacterium (Candidatus Blackallbacteria) CG13_big_fil_rev_8_21_14_2_50_49_14]